MNYKAVLFDLDGTLTDPFEGIVRSARHAFAAIDRPMPPAAELRAWVGPPLRDSFLAHLGDATLAEEALTRYREHYVASGMFDNQPYPGVAGLLAELRAGGVRLFVATSKIRRPTMGILEHFGLLGYFEAVAAPAPEHSAHKAEVIAELRPVVGADWERAVMVGDSTFDVEGARANGLACIAVSYGYGERAALEAARPLALADSVAALRALLMA